LATTQRSFSLSASVRGKREALENLARLATGRDRGRVVLHASLEVVPTPEPPKPEVKKEEPKKAEPKKKKAAKKK
jgi:hypothetical protein